MSNCPASIVSNVSSFSPVRVKKKLAFFFKPGLHTRFTKRVVRCLPQLNSPQMAKQHCQGMCSFGSWEAYDGSKCHCKKCTYHEMCGDQWHQWHTENHIEKGGHCTLCHLYSFGGRLKFRDCPEGEECAVCYGTGRQAKFTAEGCVHWFCIDCARLLMYWDEDRYHLDPRAFGCPPCPNGCDNPVRGKQCGCEEYESVISEWEHSEPTQPFLGNANDMKRVEFCQWNQREHESIEVGEPSASSFGKQMCPMCKRKAYSAYDM